MTYHFPPMDLFEKALATLNEKDIAELRSDYEHNVRENELLKTVDDYETPIFDVSTKSNRTER